MTISNLIDPDEILDEILLYYIRFKPTWDAFLEFIRIVNKVAGCSILPQTKFLILKAFSSSSSATYHLQCSHCGFYGFKYDLQDDKQSSYRCHRSVCGKLNTLEKPKVVYVTFKIKPLIQKLLMQHSDKLIFHRATQSRFPLYDIYNGEIYNSIISKHGEIIAISTNTDGVKRYRSGKDSLWPQYVVVYNLPQNIRMKEENMIITALFSGRQINMHDFYNEFVMEINAINKDGGLTHMRKQLPIFCINAALDSTARPKLQNHTQFNGFWGCGFCYSNGVSIGKCLKYPRR